ncbi:MAG: type I DNA topoisomerase [Actinomycetota bacterium]
MPKPLVIVESPAKAKTIASILGKDFVVESSIGHIRDLPPTAADIPAAYKGEPWARLGVDVDNDFKPLYVVPAKKKQQVKKLKDLLKHASELYLATDEDREGESIAWHLLEVLSPQVPVKRMVFHEITRGAIEAAVRNPRDLDRRLVDAQEARRILDRLFGYEVSPVLWKKVLPKLSAGRVQSVATKILVERERARIRFRSAGYWDLEARFAAREAVDPGGAPGFPATLVNLDGRRVATGKDFRADGTLATEDVVVLDGDAAGALADRLRPATFAVRSIDEKPFKRSPYPPFITSTLQQEAARKLRFSSRRTMDVAQSLYNKGYLTYMRTDSTTLSETAIDAARRNVRDLYGPDYLPAEPRRYKRKVKNAQEAHEAIRPAGDAFRSPKQVAPEVSGEEARLYELVWQRTMASQMSDARGQSVQVRIGGVSSDGEDAEFAAGGKVITFPGFLRAYVEGADDPDAELEDREVHLPELREGQELAVTELEAKAHATQPPARFTEASLIKKLEEIGVGRPSTYASIVSTILDRGYVWKKGTALVPSFTAFAVVDLLEKHFEQLVDYGFTARMEDDLDEIASGKEEAVPWLGRFFFGNGRPGLKTMVSERLDEIDPRAINSFTVGSGDDGRPIVLRVGRFGPYLERGEDRASVPEDVAPDELTLEKANELLDAPSGDRVLGADPVSSKPVVLKNGRYGAYVQLGEAEEGSKDKPPTASLLKSMQPETVTLDDALKLLSLPRSLGADADGIEILVMNGRYGPYLKRGADTRTLGSEELLFTLTREEALALLAQPKQGRGRGAAPLRELGADPATGAALLLKDGRFGPYVTDGTTNASLPSSDTIEGLTLERAAELLAEKRVKAPARKTKSKPRSKRTSKPKR